MKAIYYNIFGLGHINPTIPLVTALRAKGVEIIYHSSPERKDLIESSGAHFKNYGRDNYKASDYNPDKNFVLQTIPATVGLLPFLQEEFERIKPDFILYDSMAIWGYVMGEIYKTPSFCSVVTFAMPEEAKLETFRKHQVTVDITNREAIAVLKRNHDLELSLIQALGAYGKNNIVFTAKEFNPMVVQTHPEQFFFSGAMVERKEENTVFPFSSFKEQNKIVITMAVGTLLLDEDPSVLDWYRALVAAFNEDSNYQLILAIGSEKNKAALGELPSNVLAFTYLPQIEVLKHTDIFINHAGMNSINEALFFGVPMIVIPHSKDQFVNAQRVADLNLGVQLTKEEVSKENLKEKVLDLLSNYKIRNHLEIMKLNFKNHSGLDGILNYIFERIIP